MRYEPELSFDVLIKDSTFSNNTTHIAGGEDYDCAGLHTVVVKDSEPEYLNTNYNPDDD